MEWVDGVHGFVCLCFCPLNHEPDVPCNDDEIMHRGGHAICVPCARVMGIYLCLDDVKRDLVRML